MKDELGGWPASPGPKGGRGAKCPPSRHPRREIGPRLCLLPGPIVGVGLKPAPTAFGIKRPHSPGARATLIGLSPDPLSMAARSAFL